jgi:hypothetical protein
MSLGFPNPETPSLMTVMDPNKAVLITMTHSTSYELLKVMNFFCELKFLYRYQYLCDCRMMGTAVGLQGIFCRWSLTERFVGTSDRL